MRPISSASAPLVSGPVATMRDRVFGNRNHFFAPEFDTGVLFDRARNFLGEHFTVHGKRVAAGYASLLCNGAAAANPGGAIPPSAARARYFPIRS